eukprot:8514063-Lingulodinium_polyedra.AAC.1
MPLEKRGARQPAASKRGAQQPTAPIMHGPQSGAQQPATLTGVQRQRASPRGRVCSTYPSGLSCAAPTTPWAWRK